MPGSEWFEVTVTGGFCECGIRKESRRSLTSVQCDVGSGWRSRMYCVNRWSRYCQARAARTGNRGRSAIYPPPHLGLRLFCPSRDREGAAAVVVARAGRTGNRGRRVIFPAPHLGFRLFRPDTPVVDVVLWVRVVRVVVPVVDAVRAGTGTRPYRRGKPRGRICPTDTGHVTGETDTTSDYMLDNLTPP